jgi:spore maturation protein CgeB
VGAALMTDRSGDLGKYFEIDKEVATYSTPEEAVAVARRLMSDAAHREEVARAGTERTLRDHTFASRAKLLNDVLRSELQI